MKRIHSNTANSVLIYGLAITVLALLFTCISIDYTKSIYVQKQYTSYAQQATQAALKEQNGIGGLTVASLNKVVTEYLVHRNGYGGQTSESASFRKNACSSPKNAEPYPQITMELDTDRRKGTQSPLIFKYDGTLFAETGPLATRLAQEKFVVINVVITDVSDNWMSGMFMRPCQEHRIETSAVTINADWNRT